MRYWAIPKTGATKSVEAYSHNLDLSDTKREITEKEYQTFISSLPSPIYIPPRDLAKDIDALKAEVEALKK